MRKRVLQPGHSAGLRRVVTGAAAAALVATTLGTGLATAAPEASDWTAVDPLTEPVAPESKVQFADGELSGAEPAPTSWFVQLSARPTIKGGSEASIQAQHRTFEQEATSLGADLEVTSTYSALWNGMAVQGSLADVEAAAQSADVEAIFPVYLIDTPEPQDGGIAPQMDSAVDMTGVAQVHAMGITGEGMKIAIIDTGTDVDHPDFGGAGTPTDGQHADWRTDQIQFGYDFVGDDYNANPQSAAYDPVARPDANPDDCNGHGTHVASIAAGNGDPAAGGIVGVAPDATIGAYRVFGCGGSTTAEIMLSAMEMAHEDGMHVVNMSIGSAFMTWPQYPTAVAADALVDAGVKVVASIGNSGAEGTYSAGAPGVGDKVIGVASYDNAEITVNSITISPDGTEVGYMAASGGGAIPTEGETVLSRLGDPGSAEARVCVPITADLTGTTVLVERGAHPDHPACDATFYNKALQAQEAGAEAVVIYNNAPGLLTPTVAPPTPADPPVTIPVIMIMQSDGEMIDARIVAGETTMTWTDSQVTIPSPTGGLISSFSSYGLTAELGLKPDIGAPGGNITAAWPLEAGGYNTISGTSMSSPHVAGAVALLLQERPDLGADQVRDVLQNHADPAVWSLNPGLGFLEGAFRQGAGMLDLDDAILATTSISPGKVALGEGEAGPQEVSLSVTNDGDAAVTYSIGTDDGTIAVAPPTTVPTYGLLPAAVTAPSEVTVAPGETAVVDLTITPPASPDHVLYSGWVTFTPAEGDPLRVPYAGLTGDYQGIEVLTPGTNEGVELPVLGQLTGCDRLIGVDCVWGGTYDVFDDTGAGDEPVYTLVDGDVPVILAQLAHQSRSVTLTAYEANEDGSIGAEVGVVSTLDYLPRSPSTAAFQAFSWDGTFEGQTVADGKYILQLDLLKALGDPANPAHTETFTSEPFTINDASQPATSPTVDRFEGANRYATAARIAAETPAGPEVVYIATGENYPDALAGAAKAGSDGAPVLLVREGSIPAPTQLELTRLAPQNIVIFGGTAVVNGQVETQLASYTEGTVSRLFGADRYGTAAEISATYAAADTVYVATGAEFPDALAGSARAGALDAPLLLVRHGSVPEATVSELERLSPSTIVVLGGDAAVSDTVVTALGAYADTVERAEGANRFATAAAISADYAPGVSQVFVATGQEFPDALAGSARAGHLEVPVLLVRQNSIPEATLAELQRLQAPEIVILGGFGAVSEEVQNAIEALEYGG